MRKRRRSVGEGLALLLAERGYGPLLQRDYWAVIRNCRATPAALVGEVRRHLDAFAPRELVVFHRVEGRTGPIEVGEEIDVHILGAGWCRVRVIHANEQSFTLATEEGHPEAGRITFGAYRNGRGDVVFHIRSQARSSGRFARTGFLAMGEVMQTSTWTDFVNRVAVAFGDGVVGFIQAETGPVDDEPADLASAMPTFEARGG